MGRPTGFLEFARQTMTDRSPSQRVSDWDEFHLRLSHQELSQQGARCMECGIPFCHSGLMLAGMASGCPINNLIPEWNDLVYKGRWQEAYQCLRKTNNFPEFTGRVCPAPCEGSCTLGLIKDPVTIKNIEEAIIEQAYALGLVKPHPPSQRTGKQVAVVGSGPAGLACADQLNQAGHQVTVFERDDRIGGLLMYGIPNMKLDKEVIQRRISLMESEGIRFQTQTEIGPDSINELQAQFDAIVLCLGSRRPRDLQVPGRHLRGVHFAMEFLHESTQSFLDQREPQITAQGKQVVVIGGGDTGTDCLATSLRQGCLSLLQLEIMPAPPNEREPENPWPQWPKVLRQDYGHQEAQALFGHDPREFSVMTVSLLGDDRVKGICTAEIRWEKDEHGRFTPVQIPGTQKERPADLVLLAMGFTGPEQDLITAWGLETDSRSNIKAIKGLYQTNIPGVFTAGDAHRGQSLVVWAIREGREVAQEIHQYLLD